MRYRRLASPLHAARAAVSGGFCLALGAAALATRHPVLLCALAVTVVGAARVAGTGMELRRAARLAVPLALLVAAVNPLVSRQGLTVFAQLGEVPPFGQIDLTVEALVYGLVDGARVLLVVLACALFSAAVDPDELLRLLRRVSFRSALTAVLALRLVPVLARDARRLEEARRCRPDGGGTGPAARLAVLCALTSGALDRAIDVAATLEVRGYGAPAVARARGAGASALREPWSRHDLGFAAASAGLLGVAALCAGGVAGFDAYPTLRLDTGPEVLVLAVLVLVAGLAPFADRRGIAR